MKYFLFLPETNAWSEIVYTVEELCAMPGIKADSLICESEGERRTLYFSQIQRPDIASPRASEPISAQSVTDNTMKKAKRNEVPKGIKASDEAHLLEERLLTYRLVQIACRIMFFFTILPIAVPLLYVVFVIIVTPLLFMLSVPSESCLIIDAVLGGIAGVIVSYRIACRLGTKQKR